MTSMDESFLMLGRIVVRIFPASMALFVSVLSFVYAGINVRKVLWDWEKKKVADRMPYVVILVFMAIGSLAATLGVYFAIQMARIILVAGGT